VQTDFHTISLPTRRFFVCLQTLKKREDMAETKRATKKALNEFCIANELSNERIVEIIQNLFPDIFECSDEFCTYVIKALFKNYDSVSIDEVISFVKKLEKEKSIENFKIEIIKQRKEDERIRRSYNDLISRIISETEHNDLRLSQCEEWDEGVAEHIKEKCSHWAKVTDERGTYHLDIAFYKIFMYEHFKYDTPSFKIKSEGNDIVFCKQVNQFERNKQGALLDKVFKDAMTREIRLSEYPEWDENLKSYMRTEYNDWDDLYTDYGNFSYGRLFKRLLAIKFGRSQSDTDIPLNCYATRTGDVLISKQRHKWIESKGCYDFEAHSVSHKAATTNNTNTQQSSNSGCLSVIILAVIVIFGLL
jgi:hypothetical protein